MPKGTALLEEVEKREIEIMATLEVDVPASVLKGTARVLKEVRKQYDSEPWATANTSEVVPMAAPKTTTTGGDVAQPAP